MRDLHDFRKTAMRKRMDTLLGKVEKYDMSSCAFDNYIHTALSCLISMNGLDDRVGLLETYMDFSLIFDPSQPVRWDRRELFQSMVCGRYEDTGLVDGVFFPTLFELLEKKSVVFVMLDFHKYLPNDEECISAEWLYEYHATGLLFFRNTFGNIQLYHFNPHGQAGAYINVYKRCISMKRRQSVDLPTGLDRFVMSELAHALECYRLSPRCTSQLPPFDYDRTKRCNYLGPNLQAGDEQGVCCMYQAMLVHEICQHFDTKQKVQYSDVDKKGYLVVKTREFPPHRASIKEGRVFDIIMRSVASLSPDLHRHMSYDEAMEHGGVVNNARVTMGEFRYYCAMEKLIEEKGAFFIKAVLGTIVPYLTQKSLRDMIDRQTESEEA